MIAAIDLQWLGIGVAALVVVVLLIFVLLRHRGEDERLMAAARIDQGYRQGLCFVLRQDFNQSPVQRGR